MTLTQWFEASVFFAGILAAVFCLGYLVAARDVHARWEALTGYQMRYSAGESSLESGDQ